MTQMDGTEALKTISGVDDIGPLQKAGIESVEAYGLAQRRVITRLTKQKSNEVKTRQQAAGIYVRSGLDPALSLRLAEAGISRPCQLLFDDLELPLRGDWEREAVEKARINIAFDNVRQFLMDGSAANKKRVLKSLAKLPANQRQAANRSFEILRRLQQFRWLDAEAAQLERQGLDDKDVGRMMAAVTEEQARLILVQLREDCEVQ